MQTISLVSHLPVRQAFDDKHSLPVNRTKAIEPATRREAFGAKVEIAIADSPLRSRYSRDRRSMSGNSICKRFALPTSLFTRSTY
jgi:hypothetical protein